MSQKIQRPSFRLYASEIPRALRERKKYVAFRKSFNGYNTGDGHPVLVIPGFMASDHSTEPLRKFIRDLGYNPVDWGLGRNYGKMENLDILIEKTGQLFEEYQEKVSLIGWSLGGIYARQIAKAHASRVRQVITLGSPFAGITQPNNASWLYDLVRDLDKTRKKYSHILADLPKPAPLPSTAIYSKEDGIVPWQVCMELEEDATHQNIEVKAPHLALALHPEVLKIIADRLQYSADNWQRL